VALTLDLFSPSYAPSPQATGFPWFDHDEVPNASDPELQTFLEDGPAPVVVSLGSFVPHAAGEAYSRIAETLAAAGQKALLLTGPAKVANAAGTLVREYLPHSLVFPHASAVLHYGGIGTTGQALAAGRPQLVLPFMGDQFDQAARIVRLGIGEQIKRQFIERDLAAALERVMASTLSSKAAALSEIIRREDGAGNAANAIIALVRSSSTTTN
jgi:UDP:flavonoid glycosyltransferase YjiC (YdhE family)